MLSVIPGIKHPQFSRFWLLAVLGNGDLDHRSDIYSPACLMYEWEAGNLPFTGNTTEEICLKHLLQTPARLGSLFRKTTFGAEDVIRECLGICAQMMRRILVDAAAQGFVLPCVGHADGAVKLDA